MPPNTLLIPALTFLAVLAVGGAWLIAAGARRRRIRARLEMFGELTATGGDIAEDHRPWLDLLGQLGASVTPAGAPEALRQRLANAGYFTPNAATIYIGARIVMLGVGVAAAAFIVAGLTFSLPIKIMAVSGAGLVLSILPSMYIDLRRAKRTTEIQHHLPDAVDLLEICVSAGMGLDMAWNAVADEIRRVSPVLADEMALTNLEMHLGAGRSEALRHMADRTGSDDVNSLVGTLVQSERFGTSIADTLRTFAESMREVRTARAAEAAEKMGVKMLIPMIGFILPAMLIVMGGAAVIKIIDMFENL